MGNLDILKKVSAFKAEFELGHRLPETRPQKLGASSTPSVAPAS